MEASENICRRRSTLNVAEVLPLRRGCQRPCAFTIDRSCGPCCCNSRSNSPTEPHSASDLAADTIT